MSEKKLPLEEAELRVSDPLAHLTREAKEEPRDLFVDWSVVEKKLFERVKLEVASERAQTRALSRRRLWIPVAAGLAAAAAAAVSRGRGGRCAATGEAFAVDVVNPDGTSSRIAVHGTHLRVARDGDHVVVDLSEGVVSIGAPARVGSTYGELVTAPAHAELTAGVSASLRVDHTP